MALTIGEGPNRGVSAPPPGRSRPLPKPKPGSASDILSRAQTSGIAARNAREAARPAPRPAPRPSSDTLLARDWTPQWLAPTPRRDDRQDAVQQWRAIPTKPRVATRPTTIFNMRPTTLADKFSNLPAQNQQQRPLPPLVDPWIDGGVGPDGQPASVFRGIFVDPQPAADRAQIVQNVADQYNVKARLGKRDQARMDREKVDRSETTEEMTLQQWNAFTPLQQAAVQANADLAQAVKRDFDTQSKHKSSDEQFKGYQDRVSQLFGEDAGTGFKGLEYAPNTIAFLDKRGIDKIDLVGKTLDDLVSGDALVEMDAIKNLEKPVANDARARNITFAQNLAKGQLQYQEDLASQLKRGDKLLNDITGRDASSAATSAYGAKEQPARAKLTAVRPETAELMDTYMEILARTDSDVNEAIDTIHADLSERSSSDEERDQVVQALIERSRQATTGEGKWFDGIDFPMRDPADVAQALGATTLKRRG